MKNSTYEQMGNQILEHVGGIENVSFLTHCVTRLRFTLKDQSVVNETKMNDIKEIKGVLGCQFSNNQFQVIIGPEVEQVYKIIAPLVDGDEAPVSEKQKEAWTVKTAASKLLTNFTSCIIPALPVIICAGMLKMVVAILGPTLCNVIQEGTGLYTILTFAGDAGFYFLPVFLGYTTAKHFKSNVLIGMLMGAILLHPSFTTIITEGTNLELLGIPVTPTTYSYSVLPAVMIVWIMVYVRAFFDRIIPGTLKMILVDTLTVLVMLPLALCVLGPLGSILSTYINDGFIALHHIFGPFGIGLIASLFLLLILTGMHHAVNMAALIALTANGFEDVVFVAAAAGTLAVLGANLAFILKAKKKETRSLGVTATVMQAVAGIVEPTLFGIYLPYKKVFLAQAIGAFCGGTLMGFLGCKAYMLTGSNVLILAGYLGGDINNFIYACIGCGVAILVAFIAVFLLRFEEK